MNGQRTARARDSKLEANRRIPSLALVLLLAFPCLPTWARPQVGDQPSAAAEARDRLGRQLFADLLFTNPAADYSASCAGCHAVGLEVADRSPRSYADYVPRSLKASKETTLRNTLTLLDVGKMSYLKHDGSFTSLEALIESKLLGSELGWVPADRERALDAIHFVLLNEGETDTSPQTYVAQFNEAYDADLESLSRDEAFALLVRGLADFVRGLESTGTAIWDAFVSMNRLRPGPIADEDPKMYAGETLYSRIGNQEGRRLVKRPKGFTQEAYRGFKIFYRTSGEASSGNCVTCHVPPAFTDFKFHVTGIAEAEYDQVHGVGAFAKLAIPVGADAARPVDDFLAVPSLDHPGRADLGYWNFAALSNSPLRRPGESPEELLARMTGAFKTPTLRNLARTDPYMHNGAYPTLRAAVAEIVRLNQLARAGKLRQIDPEYRVMNLSEKDIDPLTAFLGSLDEVGREEFREFLMTLAED